MEGGGVSTCGVAIPIPANTTRAFCPPESFVHWMTCACDSSPYRLPALVGSAEEETCVNSDKDTFNDKQSPIILIQSNTRTRGSWCPPPGMGVDGPQLRSAALLRGIRWVLVPLSECLGGGAGRQKLFSWEGEYIRVSGREKSRGGGGLSVWRMATGDMTGFACANARECPVNPGRSSQPGFLHPLASLA